MQTSNSITKINRPQREKQSLKYDSDNKRKTIRKQRRNKMIIREAI